MGISLGLGIRSLINVFRFTRRSVRLLPDLLSVLEIHTSLDRMLHLDAHEVEETGVGGCGTGLHVRDGDSIGHIGDLNSVIGDGSGIVTVGRDVVEVARLRLAATLIEDDVEVAVVVVVAVEVEVEVEVPVFVFVEVLVEVDVEVFSPNIQFSTF